MSGPRNDDDDDDDERVPFLVPDQESNVLRIRGGRNMETIKIGRIRKLRNDDHK